MTDTKGECTACEARLLDASRRLDGLLSSVEEARLDEHLEACPQCREEARGLERGVALLRSVAAAPAPAGLQARIQAAVSSHARRPAPLVPLLRSRTTAAGLLLAVGLGLSLLFVQGAPPSFAGRTMAELHLEADDFLSLYPEDVRERVQEILALSDEQLAALTERRQAARAVVQEILTDLEDGRHFQTPGTFDGKVDVDGVLRLLDVALDRQDHPVAPPNPGIWPIDDSEWLRLWDAVTELAETRGRQHELLGATISALREVPSRDDEAARARLDELLPD